MDHSRTVKRFIARGRPSALQSTNPMAQESAYIRVLLIFSAAYMLLLFPFAYFRHDDWIIIFNGLVLEDRWQFAFEPYLYYGAGDLGVWFFRPLFKGIVYIFFTIFSFSYYPWLLFHLICAVASLNYGFKIIQRTVQDDKTAYFFVLMFACSVHLQIGSLLWVGEGMMNCPQVFLLIWSLYLFVESWFKRSWFRRWLYQVAALAPYILAIGIKESTIVHSGFLVGYMLINPFFRKQALSRRVYSALPYLIIGVAFAIYRLGVLPINSAYIPNASVLTIILSALKFIVLLGLTEAVLFSMLYMTGNTAGLSAYKRLLKRRWPMLPFLIVSIAPLIGQDFFSPGWLYFPGFFLLLSLADKELSACLNYKKLVTAGISIVLLSSAVVLFKIQKLGWFSWHTPQSKIVEIFQAADPLSVEKIAIYQCPNPRYSESHFARVIGGTAQIQSLWHILHKTRVEVGSYHRCDLNLIPKMASEQDETLRLWYNFPNLMVIDSGRRDKTAYISPSGASVRFTY